jgi:uncharacterized phage protein (TIGR02218 family)
MKTLDADLRADLEHGAAYLAMAWMLRRRDGFELRVTDHDQSLLIDGHVFEPGGAIGLGQFESTATSGADELEAIGVLNSDAITESDIVDGLWDDAELRAYAVDWMRKSAPIPLLHAWIERIEVKDRAFEARLSNLRSKLEAPIGRIYQRVCDAQFGDRRCGVDAVQPAYRSAIEILTVHDDRTVEVSSAGDRQSGWFTRGVLLSHDGRSFGIEEDERKGNRRRLRLDRSVSALSLGPGAYAIAGCEKTFEACVGKFSNGINFRGFPHMPGPDSVLSASGLRAQSTESGE